MQIMIKVGSRVKFISDTGVGIVRSIKGNIAYVEVEDGFEIPAVLNDIVEVEIQQENEAIVKIGPSDPKPVPSPNSGTGSAKSNNKHRINQGRGINNYGRVSIADDFHDDEPLDLAKLRRQYSAQAAVDAAQGSDPKLKVDVAPMLPPWEVTDYVVKLLMVPTKATSDGTLDMSADLDAYLVNDSSYSVFYNIARRERAGYYSTISSGTIESDSKVMIRTFKRAEIAEIITLRISLLPYKITSFTPRSVDAFDLDLHPLKFVRENNFTENDYFDSHAVVYTLADADQEVQPTVATQHPQNTKATAKPSATPRVKPPGGEGVIDLHAEELLESTDGLTPGEIITAQLARFIITLDGAINQGKGQKLIFIHGMGKGKLRYELEKILKRDYPKLRYQDASFEEYGYGAIMVFTK